MPVPSPTSAFRKLNSTLHGSICLLCMALVPTLALNGARGEELHNGTNCLGTLPDSGSNKYTFSVNVGDYLTLSALKTGGVFRQPGIALYAPNGSATFSANGNQAALLTNRAILSGTYTAVVYNAVSTAGFSYVLRLAQLPAPFIVPTGDDGGSLTNGRPALGTLSQGDLDLWTFVANAGDHVALRAGTDNLALRIEVRGPEGQLLSAGGPSATDCLIEITNASAGTYVLSVRAHNIATSGDYRLNLARMPGIATPVGMLFNGVNNNATLSRGGLDQWALYACKSNLISVRCQAQGSTVYYPRIQVFAQDGHVLGDTSTARHQINTLSLRAPYSGRFTVLIQSVNLGGDGPYLLSGTGLVADGMTVCPPLVLGDELELGGFRGVPNAPYELLSTTNLLQPGAGWELFTTGRFNEWGSFEFRTNFHRAELQRCFQIRTP